MLSNMYHNETTVMISFDDLFMKLQNLGYLSEMMFKRYLEKTMICI